MIMKELLQYSYHSHPLLPRNHDLPLIVVKTIAVIITAIAVVVTVTIVVIVFTTTITITVAASYHRTLRNSVIVEKKEPSSTKLTFAVHLLLHNRHSTRT